MNVIKQNFKTTFRYLARHINKNMVRNVFFFGGGIILFIAGLIIYGVILNLREIPLSQAMRNNGYSELDHPSIVVERNNYSLKLYEDTVLIKSYRASFGRNVNGHKSVAGDMATPVGEYKVCEIDTVHKYYKFLKLNYPNLNDATEALRKGIINQDEYDQLRFEFYYGNCPNSNTALGDDIGIHGIGRLNYIFKYLPFVYNWTNGSIAVSNESIDELYSVVKKGTEVVIK